MAFKVASRGGLCVLGVLLKRLELDWIDWAFGVGWCELSVVLSGVQSVSTLLIWASSACGGLGM